MSNEMSETIATLRRENAALRKAVALERAGTIAVLGLGSPDLAAAFAGKLEVNIAGDRVEVFTKDTAGKRKTVYDTGKREFRPLTHEEFLAELRERHPQLPWRTSANESTSAAPAEAPQAQTSDELLDKLRRDSARLSAERQAANEAFVAEMRTNNPFAAPTTNLTHQMRLMRVAPDVAETLKQAAGVA